MTRLSTTLLCLLLLPLSVYSQGLKGTVRVGQGQPYYSLTGDSLGLFKHLAKEGLAGDLDILICSDLKEKGTHMLSLLSSSTYTIRIRPDKAEMRTIFNSAISRPTLRISEKVRVVVDGRFPYRSNNDYTQTEAPNMGQRFLRFVNGTTDINSGIPNSAIEVQNNSNGHVISSCLFYSMEQSGYGSCILLGNGVTSQINKTIKNLRIEYCDFDGIKGTEGWGPPWNKAQQVFFGIYAYYIKDDNTATYGSTQVTIAHNRFYNTQWAGICMAGQHTDWRIEGNSFEKKGDCTDARLPAQAADKLNEMTSLSYTAIWVQAPGPCFIKDNRIGGTKQSPLTCKVYNTPFTFRGILARENTLGEQSDIRITGNQISYLLLHTDESSTRPSSMIGIEVKNRKAYIADNTLQSLTLQLHTKQPYIKDEPQYSQLTGIRLESPKNESLVQNNLMADCALKGYATLSLYYATPLLLQGIYAIGGTSAQHLQVLNNRLLRLRGDFKYPTTLSSNKQIADMAYGIRIEDSDSPIPICLLEGNQVDSLMVYDLSSSSNLDKDTPSAWGIQAYGQLKNNSVSNMKVAGKAVGIELLGRLQGSLQSNRLWNLQARQLTGFRCNSTQAHFHNSSRQQGGIGWEQTGTGQLYHNVLYIEPATETAFSGGASAQPLSYPTGATVQNNLLLMPHADYRDANLEGRNLLISSFTAVQASLLRNEKSRFFRNWAEGDLRLRLDGNLSPCIPLLDLLVDKGTHNSAIPQDADGISYAGAPDYGLVEFLHQWPPGESTDGNQAVNWPLRMLPADTNPCSQHIWIPAGTACSWTERPLPLRSLRIGGTLTLSGNMTISQQIPQATSAMRGVWVQTGGLLDLQAYTGMLSLSQNLQIDGRWTSGAHGLQLGGKGTQLLQSTTPITVEKLTVNRETDGTIPSVCQVQLPLEAKHLEMQQGVLKIDPGKSLVIGESATGGGLGAFVMGWVNYRNSAEAVLPLGAIGRYAPLQVDKGPLEACFMEATPPDRLVDISPTGYWWLRTQQATICAVSPLQEGHVQLWRHLPELTNWTYLQTTIRPLRSNSSLLQGSMPEGEVRFTTGNVPEVAPAWDLLLNARREGRMVRLAWTYKGLPVLGFDIEHSQDGVLFVQVGKVEGDARTFSEHRSEKGYYRLKIWQREGGTGYSRPIALEGSQVQGLSLWPNPWGQGALQLHTEEKGEILLQLCNLQGRQVAQWRTRTADGRLYWALPPLPSGCYLLILNGPLGKHCSRLVIQ